jgi:alpha-1,3-glucosyltransferase
MKSFSKVGFRRKQNSHLIIDPKLCAVLTLISMLPALYTTFTKPTRQNLLLSYCSCALSSFLFGWHVHEKAILLVILPLSGLLFLDENRFFRPFIFLTVAGHSGLLPLIFTQFEQVRLFVYF